MLPICRFALKEWAAVCAALAHGRQSILLRKGGIAEAGDEFRVEHPEFWLYPTRFHQSSDELTPEADSLPGDPAAAAPPPGTVELSLYGVLAGACQVKDASQLGALDGLHVLTQSTLLKRFEYRQPGLNVLLVRIYRRAEPFSISESPHFAGCHSWVDLRNKLPTAGLVPVVDDATFETLSADVRRRLKDA